MEHTSFDQSIARFIEGGKPGYLDARLPEWARRSNPIVRRHLGSYWKTVPVEFDTLIKWWFIQSLYIAASAVYPGLLTLIIPLVPAALLLAPITFGFYGYLLLNITKTAVAYMSEERRNETLPLLLTTPMSLGSVLRSKIAAGVWRQMDNIGVALMAGTIIGLPLVIMQYSTLWPVEQHPLLMRTAAFLSLTSSLLRLILEPAMVGALGVFMGAAVGSRVPATGAALGTVTFYFIMVSLPRLLPMEWPLRLIVEIAMPLVLPVLVITAAFYGARTVLLRE